MVWMGKGAVPALWSFLFPGLGQLYGGFYWRAAVFCALFWMGLLLPALALGLFPLAFLAAWDCLRERKQEYLLKRDPGFAKATPGRRLPFQKTAYWIVGGVGFLSWFSLFAPKALQLLSAFFRRFAGVVLLLSCSLASAEEQPEISGDLVKLGEKVAKQVDQIVQKSSFRMWGDPWLFQGIPLLFPSARDGFNLGIRLQMQNIRRIDPHQFEVQFQLLSSDLGRYKHVLRLDSPRAFGGNVRWLVGANYDRDISVRYFGIGNNTSVDRALLDANSVLYQHVRATPSVFFRWLFNVSPTVSLGPSLGFRWTQFDAPVGSLLADQSPYGLQGGRTHWLGLVLLYNRVDFEPYPTRGTVHEIYADYSGPVVSSDYEFTRLTYTYRYYYPLRYNLIFAHRTLVEGFIGNVPFFEYGIVEGWNPTLGFGGLRFLRGFEPNRFMDRIRTCFGFELRWDAMDFDFSGQDVTLGIVPFVDIGRVWPSLDALALSDFHAAAGWGLRLLWNRRFTIRADYAINSERQSFYIDLGNAF